MNLRFLTAIPRQISVLARRRRSIHERRRIQAAFLEWRASQADLPPGRPRNGELLLIRLDDIGDYLLFRNQLTAYRHSPRWQGHRITLLANSAWQSLFTGFDAPNVDAVVWVNKAQYLASAPYRREIWESLRAQGFDTVIAPARTRPLLLDDLCMLAAAPRRSLGSRNTYVHPNWNRLSDALYDELFVPADVRVHEFEFNGQFAEWAAERRYTGARPKLDAAEPLVPGNYLLCFLGANTRSKRWPAKRWIELIQAYREGVGKRVVLAGNSGAEQRMAAAIQQSTGVESIAGQVTLMEFVAWVRGARAVVTNDTMAAHLAASLSRPTVIVANGVNYARFTEYGAAHIEGVATAYPAVFLAKRARRPDMEHHYADAITADITSIRARAVLTLLRQVMQ